MGHFTKTSGVIEKSLGRSQKDRKKVVVRSDGKNAITEFEVIEAFDFLTLIKLKLHTGRTHQIRVHMHSIGHPVFGDPGYEGRKPHGVQPIKGAFMRSQQTEKIKFLLELMPRQALHAKVLGFKHPITGAYKKFESELPEDMNRLLEQLHKGENA